MFLKNGTKILLVQLSETLQGHVDDIRALLQCGICIRPLYEPFTLACGHTFCYSVGGPHLYDLLGRVLTLRASVFNVMVCWREVQ